MANNDGNQSNNIPINTEKVLFAEGLVNYILRTNSLPGILLSSEEQEESEIRICDTYMRMAVALNNNTVRCYTEMTFKFIMDNNLNTRQDFAIFAVTVKSKFLRKEPYHEAFLQYSVHLAQLAGKLYAEGINEAPRIAVSYIVEAMIFDLARFEYEITDMIAREYRRQSMYNIVLCRQDEELGYGQPTNPYNVSSLGDIGVPGPSRTEPINLNVDSSDSD